jgi:hypothetical protein
VIAKKIPPGPGKPGVSVTGQEIAPNPGKDVPFPAGQNTKVSPDGMFLLAEKAGVLKKEAGVIAVSEQLKIPGDVDFSVGNIKHTGDLEISGSVQPGFVVEAEGNILIHGLVESARIHSRNGKIVVRQGILGKTDAPTHVEAKTGIEVTFAQNADLKTDGVLVSEKFCLHCTITCDIFEASKLAGGVVGGCVRASTHIKAHQVGNENIGETKLVLFDKNKEETLGKIKELLALKEKLTTAMEPIKKQVQTKAAIFKKAGAIVSDRQKAELKKWIEDYNQMQLKVKYVDQKLTEMQATLNNPTNYTGFIQVVGDMYPGTVLDFYGMTKLIKVITSNKRFRIKDSQIDTEG